MRRLLMTVGCLLFMGGCAAHYYEVEDNMLTLYLDKPGAHKVILACSLDGFQPHEVPKVEGRWTIALPALASFQYFYIVDGNLYLPDCSMRVRDDFGAENCIFDPQL